MTLEEMKNMPLGEKVQLSGREVMRVPFGWIFTAYYSNGTGSASVHQVFVYDASLS